MTAVTPHESALLQAAQTALLMRASMMPRRDAMSRMSGITDAQYIFLKKKLLFKR